MNQVPATLSLIIPTKNRSKTLGELLFRLTSQTILPLEILVIDNGTRQEYRKTSAVCAAFADRLPLKPVHHEENGVCEARNRGLSLARGEIIAFLDDDCLPTDGWVEAILTVFERDEAVLAVQGLTNQRLHPRLPMADILELGTILPIERMLATEENRVRILNTQNCAFKRKVVNEMNPLFDPSLIACEDLDLYIRLERHLIPVHFCKEMEVIHERRWTVGGFIRTWHTWGFYKGVLIRRYPEIDLPYYRPGTENLGTAIILTIKEIFAHDRYSYFKTKIIARRHWIKGLIFYPAVFLQTTSFIGGMVRGRRSGENR